MNQFGPDSDYFVESSDLENVEGEFSIIDVLGIEEVDTGTVQPYLF